MRSLWLADHLRLPSRDYLPVRFHSSPVPRRFDKVPLSKVSAGEYLSLKINSSRDETDEPLPQGWHFFSYGFKGMR